MVFDFGRCVFSPEQWLVQGYFHNNNTVSEKEFLKVHPEFDRNDPVQLEAFNMATREKYIVLIMYFQSNYVSINIFDEDIDKFYSRLSATLRGKTQVCTLNDINFYDKMDALEFDSHVRGSITTYER